MSIFGYPARVIHRQMLLDQWGRPYGYNDVETPAKVVEEQKIIKNDRGEDVKSNLEIHIEGSPVITSKDVFFYSKGHYYGDPKAPNLEIRPLVIEVKKQLATDNVKKVIIYG